MKAKLFVVGLVALLMVAGFVMVSCAGPCNIEAGGCSIGLSSGGGLDITACTSSDCGVNKALDDYYTMSALPECSCK